MEKVYRKVIKGKKTYYESCGYNDVPDLHDGIWLVQSNTHSKSMASLVWKVGELKRPADIVTHATLQTMSDDLCHYLLKLSDDTSEEFKDAKQFMGGWLNTPPVFNISPSNIVSLFIREIAKKLEDGELINLDSIFMDFRSTLEINNPDYGAEVRLLYKLSEWLSKNNYQLKK